MVLVRIIFSGLIVSLSVVVSHIGIVICQAVRKDNKQRFSLVEENGELLIRANQGHTLAVMFILKLCNHDAYTIICIYRIIGPMRVSVLPVWIPVQLVFVNSLYCGFVGQLEYGRQSFWKFCFTLFGYILLNC